VEVWSNSTIMGPCCPLLIGFLKVQLIWNSYNNSFQGNQNFKHQFFKYININKDYFNNSFTDLNIQC